MKANSKALSSDRLLGISKSLKNPYDVGGYESKCSEVSRYLKYLKDRDIGNDYLDGRVGFLFDLVSERKPNREYTTADYGRITVSYPVYSFLILHVNLSRRIIDEWEQESVFIGNIKTMKGANEFAAPTQVRLYVGQNHFCERGDAGAYLCPSKGLLKFRRQIRDQESRPLGNYGRGAFLEDRNPGVVERSSEVVDRISHEQRKVGFEIEQVNVARIHDSLRSGLFISVNPGGIVLWESPENSLNLGDMYVGPINL